MKTDVRARYTRRVIIDAFVDLWQQKPLAKITVREICEKAQINRSTFYKHYQDCYDLRDRLEEETLDNLEQVFAAIPTAGLQPVLTSVLQFMQSNREILAMQADPAEVSTFTQRMIERCFRRMGDWLPEGPNEADGARGMYHAFLFGGAGAVVEYWVRHGMDKPPEQVAQVIRALCVNASAKGARKE